MLQAGNHWEAGVGLLHASKNISEYAIIHRTRAIEIFQNYVIHPELHTTELEDKIGK